MKKKKHYLKIILDGHAFDKKKKNIKKKNSKIKIMAKDITRSLELHRKKNHENRNIAPTKLYKGRVESSPLLILKIL